MNANYKRLPARFAPEVRFPVKPTELGARQERKFKWLKNQLLFDRLDDVRGPKFNGHVRRAASEAEALAWATPFPLLVFPVLFEEKADDAAVRFVRQAQILESSRELLAV